MADNTNQDHEDAAAQDVRARIIHTLEICPYITRAMIQVALGPGLSPKFWDHTLQEMVIEGAVKLVETTVATPGGRALNKGIYHLPQYAYPPAKVNEIERD